MEDLNLKHKKILIVDDEPDLLEIIASEFDLVGANVYQADSVEKAIVVLGKTNIDAVISDVRMPHKTGIDLLTFIKQKNIHHPLTILISGYTDVTMQDIYHLGAEGFLAKPFKLEDLLFTTSRLLKATGTNWPLYDSTKLPNLVQTTNLAFSDALERRVFEIGRGGCSMYLTQDHQMSLENEELNFSIAFKDLILKGSGCIRWQEHNPNAMDKKVGLEFFSLDSQSHEILRDYLTLHKTTPYIPYLK